MTTPSGDKVRDYVQCLTPQARGHLLTELERLHLAGSEFVGSEALLAGLRAEFRKGGNAHDRVGGPSRYFFRPLEPVLVNCAPERANPGQISRGSLAVIWEWFNHSLLPAMAREYDGKMRQVIIASNPHEAERIADAFQSKIAKSLEDLLVSADGAERTRQELAMLTSSRAVFDDLVKMRSLLQARRALARFSEALPRSMDVFDGEPLAGVRDLLDTLRNKHPDAVPFALTILAKRLTPSWQLIRLATKSAPSKNADDIAATPYAISVSMVLDQLDDKRLALARALKNDRVLIAREILTDIYDVEYAVRVRIDLVPDRDWGRRLDGFMKAVAADLDTEFHKIPRNLHHVLASASLHSSNTMAGRLTYLTWKVRDILTSGTTYCRRAWRDRLQRLTGGSNAA
jgi:hypothetical protein